MMSNNKPTPHPNAAIIHAWADGVQIQRMSNSTWFDVQKPRDNGNNPVPDFSPLLKWRIKPETVRYRLYLFDVNGIKRIGSYNAGQHYNPESYKDFIEWRGDWKEYEI